MFTYQKLLTTFFLCVCFALNTNAQITFGAHANASIPLFGWRHAYGVGGGAGAKFGYNLSDVFSINLSGDYFYFRGQETRFMEKVKFPIHANGEARFKIGRFTPHVGLGAGVTLQRDITIGFRRKYTDFSANAAAGVRFKFSDRVSIALNTRFFWDRDSPTQSISLGFGVSL